MPIIDVDTSTNITYSITITQLDTTKVNDINKVVSHVHWKLTAVSQTGKSVFMTATTPFQTTTVSWIDKVTKRQFTINSEFDENNYTPFEELTEETVLSWVQNHPTYSDIDKIKLALKERLEKLSISNNNDLPWS